MNEIWTCYHSVADWTEVERWSVYLRRVEALLGSKLTHLDVNDPVRRRAHSLQDTGEFICAFGPEEGSRWLLGKFGGIGVDISIQHYRDIGHYANTCKWHFPVRFFQLPGRWEIVKRLFELGNDCLSPFYSYTDRADIMAAIAVKKRVSGAVDIQAELLGVFWLTYFSAAYVDFFGGERFTGLASARLLVDGGVSLELAETPGLLSEEERYRAMVQLGRESFVDVADPKTKPRGQFALTFGQLVSFSKR